MTTLSVLSPNKVLACFRPVCLLVFGVPFISGVAVLPDLSQYFSEYSVIIRNFGAHHIT